MDNADKLTSILSLIGNALTIAAILIFVAGVVAWFRGILPAILRLGSGLAHGKVAIFAKGDQMNSLMALLADTKLFRKGNLISVATVADIGRAKDAAVYLIFWPDWEADIDQVLASKSEGSALVVYAPPDLGAIPSTRMEQLGQSRSAIVTNFRGRLLNDLVISMITTSYQ